MLEARLGPVQIGPRRDPWHTSRDSSSHRRSWAIHMADRSGVIEAVASHSRSAPTGQKVQRAPPAFPPNQAIDYEHRHSRFRIVAMLL